MRRVAILAVTLSLSLVAEAQAGITSHHATPAEARAITAAAARAGFPTRTYRQTAIRVTNNGWAVSTPVARNPQNQGNGVVIYHKVRGRWGETAEGSDFHDAPPQGRPRYGIPPRAVLHALGLV
jgi:hypothetical protein